MVKMIKWSKERKERKKERPLGTDSLISSAESAEDGVHFCGESWGLISLVRVLVNDCHSDVSPVNNSDSDAFGYFLRTINWSAIDKSIQHLSNKNSNGIVIRDTMHWTSDGFAYPYPWIYSCRIAGKFTSNFRSHACLTMPSWSGITMYRNILRSFWTLDHFGPSCRSHLLSFWSKYVWHFAPPTWVFESSSQAIWTPWRFCYLSLKKARPCKLRQLSVF